jgi:hypothetical protein
MSEPIRYIGPGVRGKILPGKEKNGRCRGCQRDVVFRYEVPSMEAPILVCRMCLWSYLYRLG